ncbi:MAG TPA: aminoacyl-tRNA hydrolase [Deltaproteobacteria bacterium]|nr:aminoacyl-tRNA hydrolase [Deltaproteobacteria bacterium]
MFIVAGLGNPGPRYEATRHNVGFMLVDRLAGLCGASFAERGGALLAETELAGTDVLLCKPLTYMNRSGTAVAAVMAAWGVEPERLIVCFDDCDLPPGRIRIRRGGGSGGHRGVASIIDSLGTDAFPRVRLGIGRPRDAAVSEYVLSPFDDDEHDILDTMLEKAAHCVEAIVSKGIDTAMNNFNAP